MLNAIGIIMFITVGHFFGALLVYLNHRFIFHTKLGNLPLLKNLKKLHAMHHAHAYNEQRNKYILVPFMWIIAIFIKIILIGVLINIWFAIGIGTFSLLYSYRHYAIHNNDKSSRFFRHHKMHHINPKYNFSGIYPFIDFIFRTGLGEKTLPA